MSESRRRELLPLHEVSNRPEAVERCIGPIMTMAAISQIESVSEPKTFKAVAVDARPTNPYNQSDPENYHLTAVRDAGQASSDLGTLAEYNKGDIYDLTGADTALIKGLGLTEPQSQMFDSFVHERLNIQKSLRDSFTTQAYMIGKIVIPAYTAARHGIRTTPELNRTLKAERRKIPEIMTSEVLQVITRSLSFTANEVLAHAGQTNADVFDAANRKLYAKGFKHNMVPIFDFCKLDEAGKVIISPAAVLALRSFMKHDNQSEVINARGTRTHGSRGCPVSIKTVDIREDDFTDAQKERLFGGDNPIARHDKEKGTLTILRDPISEYTSLLAKIVRKNRKWLK